MRPVIALITLLAASTSALPSNYKRSPATETVNPNAVTGTICTAKGVYVFISPNFSSNLPFHPPILYTF